MSCCYEVTLRLLFEGCTKNLSWWNNRTASKLHSVPLKSDWIAVRSRKIRKHSVPNPCIRWTMVASCLSYCVCIRTLNSISWAFNAKLLSCCHLVKLMRCCFWCDNNFINILFAMIVTRWRECIEWLASNRKRSLNAFKWIFDTKIGSFAHFNEEFQIASRSPPVVESNLACNCGDMNMDFMH